MTELRAQTILPIRVHVSNQSKDDQEMGVHTRAPQQYQRAEENASVVFHVACRRLTFPTMAITNVRARSTIQK